MRSTIQITVSNWFNIGVIGRQWLTIVRNWEIASRRVINRFTMYPLAPVSIIFNDRSKSRQYQKIYLWSILLFCHHSLVRMNPGWTSLLWENFYFIDDCHRWTTVKCATQGLRRFECSNVGRSVIFVKSHMGNILTNQYQHGGTNHLSRQIDLANHETV